jgi:hypothetical protein
MGASKPPVERLTYSMNEFAVAIGVCRRSLEYAIARGELRPRRVGGRVLITRAEGERFLSRDRRLTK